MTLINQLKSAWKEYISRQSLQTIVDPLIANSWQRCSPRLNPNHQPLLKSLSPENLLAAQIANFSLISIARPIMEDIHQFIENTDTIVLISNNAGYVLDLLGDMTMKAVAKYFDIKTGVLLSEDQMGTNAFSLALIDRVPARVVGPEHFLAHYHDLADAASPIFDPYGRSLGTLGFLTSVRKFHPHTLGLVVAGARAIEGLWQSELFLQEQNTQLAELNAILASISDGILVWNADQVLLHANTAATNILDRPRESLIGRPIQENIIFPTSIRNAIKQKQPLTDIETNLSVNQHSINCVISLRFVHAQQDNFWTILTLRQAEDVRQLVQHQVGAQVSVSIEDLVGASNLIRQTRRLAKTAAPAKASILIRGEGGTGKDYLARAIHNESPRRDGPFLIFACSSVPNELVVGELLGYEESTLDQQVGGRPSKFELGHGGTLFFQDVDSLPLEAQAILLNVLELGIVQRLGSPRPIEVDIRIIAASEADLEQLVADGSLRADLYYRLSPFEINLPPLRERPQDTLQLIERILERLSRQHRKQLALADGVLDVLQNYPWPGNIRELEAVLERCALQAGTSELIGPMHLPVYIRQPSTLVTKTDRVQHVPSLTMVEREAIIQAARSCNGNITHMAKVLGIGRTTVWRKVKDLNIPMEYYRKR